jgi:16S rRNA G966 N2-methylase RsmD
VEDDPEAVAVLRANVEHLRFRSAFVVAQPVERFLAWTPSPATTSPSVDPPYELDVVPTLELLAPWLVPDASVAVERPPAAELAWPAAYEPVRERRTARRPSGTRC